MVELVLTHLVALGILRSLMTHSRRGSSCTDLVERRGTRQQASPQDAKSVYHVRTRRHIENRIALDMFRNMRLTRRNITNDTLYYARWTGLTPFLRYSAEKNRTVESRDLICPKKSDTSKCKIA